MEPTKLQIFRGVEVLLSRICIPDFPTGCVGFGLAN